MLMNKFVIKWLLVFGLGLAFFICPQTAVQAQTVSEKIDNYNVEINVNKDASLNVKETIEYDFGDSEKHGIYRDIPYRYKARGGNFSLDLSNFKVSDTKGNNYTYAISNQGDKKHIRIGDANALVTGKKTYVISYDVNRAINYFDDHDELYWNAIGTEWQVPIEQSQVTVTWPDKLPDQFVMRKCFAGYYGTQESCQTTNFNQAGNNQANQVNFTHSHLDPYEVFTIVVGLPAGTVAKPTAWERFIAIAKDNWAVGLPFLTFAGMFYLWYTRGRDPEGKKTIVPQYDIPDNLSPLEIGAIMEETVKNKYLSAAIIQLAVKGYLRINRTETKVLFIKSTDYKLEQLKNADDLESEIEKDILNGIFSFGTMVNDDSKVLAVVNLSNLRNKFYKKLEAITSNVNKSVVDKGYFPNNPATIKGIYVSIGVAVMFLGLISGIYLTSLIAAGCIILSGVIIIVFGVAMPHRTAKGVSTKEYILGLKQYLQVAEKDRLNFHNAPEKAPKTFEKFLPVAMVLGVEQAWAKQFEDMYKTPPEWYNDPSGTHFNSLLLANSLGSFASSANSTMVSSPSSAASGGSGFSGGGGGGGFGGGGGGSW